MTAMNRRSTVAFSGAGIFLVGVMMLASDTAPRPVAPQVVSPWAPVFLPKQSTESATTVQNYWAPDSTGIPRHSDGLTLNDVRDVIQKWATAAQNRDVDAVVELYDAQIGRLLGTVDDSSSPRRNTREMIRDYFNHFLGNHEKLLPIFPKFDPKDVQFIDEYTAAYSGYYTFELTPHGAETKVANAKFTYIVHRTLRDGVQIVLHNSGMTPKGVVLKSDMNTGLFQKLTAK